MRMFRWKSGGWGMNVNELSRQGATLAAEAPVQAPAFATKAMARLLDTLGWTVHASRRRSIAHHAPLQCCFLLRDGHRAEAAFGFTGLCLPESADAALLQAQSQVGAFLARIGQSRGVLLQNRPLIAFGQNTVDRVAVFGGWRLRDGVWAPFLLAPDGLGGVEQQAELFASATLPAHLAEVAGHRATRALPRIAALLRHIDGPAAAAPNGKKALRLSPFGGGWSMPHLGQSRTPAPVLQLRPGSRTGPAPSAEDPAWAPGSDEFRFHALGVERK